MNLKYKLISFATSLALIGTMAANALAEKPSTPAVKQPTITLTTSTPNIQVGQSVEIALSIDAQEEGFAGLSAFVECDQAGLTPTKVISSIGDDVGKNFTTFSPTKKADNTFSGLVLSGTTVQKVKLESAAVYTFTAEKVGTYTVSVRGKYSDAPNTSTSYSAVSPLTITVSAKTLKASVSNSAMLSGTYGDSWEALAKQIDKSKVQLSESVKGTWAYAGTAARPTVADKSADFIFTPEDAATYSTATASFTLNIAPKELKPVLNLSDKMYDGSNAVTKGQNASVSLEGVLDKDDVSAEYKEISYDSENAGEHTATASGIVLTGDQKDNYKLSADSCTAKGRITPYTGKVTVQKNIASRSYDGEKHPLTNEELTLTADEIVDENRKKLTLDTDYTVSYSKEPIGSQENDMSITYTLSGKGNYEGCDFTEDTGSFTILKRPMPNASGSLQDASFTIGEKYTPQKPGISVTGKDGKTVAGSILLRYKAENSSWTADVPSQPGKYSIGAYFKSDDAAYSSGMLENVTAATLTVYKTLSQKDFTLDKTEFTYSGKQQQPAVSPAVNSALSAETDYTVSVPESVNVDNYKIKVEGKGYYKGEVQFDYTIAKAAGSGSVTMADYTYGEAAPAPVATSATNSIDQVRYTGRDGTNYTASATPPTNAGSYTVTASFKESANATACTATANFTVHRKGLVADKFTLNQTEFTYNGEAQKPIVSVAEDRKLDKDTDYTVESPESTNAGSYKVTVTGKGNYTGTVELSYKINPAVYKLPEGAKITTELETYPVNIYGGQPLSHIGLKATGLPEGAQFGWKAGDTKLATSAGDPVSYDVTVDPNDPNYSPVTTTVSVTLAKAIAPAADEKGITGQLSTVAASISKTASEKGKLSAGASADIAKLTLSGKLTPKEQDDLKSAHLSDTALLDALDKSAENVTVSTQLNKGEKSALTDLAITTGGKAALGESSGTATYTAKDITPEKPADGQLIEVELSLSSGQQAQQPAVPVLVSLSFNAKNADPNGKFQVVHKHTEADDASKNFTTQYDCRSVSKSGDTVTVQFLAASFSSFSIQYTAPASGGSSSPSATPKPDEPQPQPTAAPALTASETTWLGGYGALLNAKSGTALSLDVTACEYLPGYIITGVQKSGVTLNLSTPAGKLCLSPAVAKAMNGSYNYTFADALAIAGKVAAAAKPAASPAPVKDPTAASPTPAPTPVPTAAPQPTQAPAPQPEAEPQEKSHSPLPMVAAVLVAAALLAGGYLAYNSASRRKALHDVYAPSKKVKLNQNQNNGQGRK